MRFGFKLITVFCIAFMLNCPIVFSQEIGIQLYSLREQFKQDVPGTLKLISSWGISKIEGGEDTYGVPEEEFVALLKKNGLDVVSVGTSFEELQESPQKALARANTFDAKYIMCPWIPHDGNNFTIKDTKKAVKVFNETGAMLKAAGKELVYHAHGYEFRPYKGGTLFDYMVENALDFNFEMDVYWFAHGGADPLQMLRKYPTKFKLMHLKDMAVGTVGDTSGHSDVETNVVLGTGSIDIKALVTEGTRLGIKYMFIEDESSNVVTQVPKSLSFLMKL
ncbi:sugar phosphate isomerase/epimerase family protein [Spongiimicrobium sp. 3-5]|uniref:sugar phosphate isomerase/epimerase family protein n=1 Tax=Spongiimicrobium sp. 3-5 TaxID=3332596 RepID=UPI00397FEE29